MRGEDVFYEINDENVRELRKRYNKIRRWVIADFLRRSGRRSGKNCAYLQPSRWQGDQTNLQRAGQNGK